VTGQGADQRSLFRRWPAGVSVVVAESGGRRHGLTVSSLVSLSLDPPLVGISIAQ
jgi:flavin reductase (DIM6/NTAB) family NADH-FMN oxidoreductase RutF